MLKQMFSMQRDFGRPMAADWEGSAGAESVGVDVSSVVLYFVE